VQELDISSNLLETLDQTFLQDVGVSSLERLDASNNLIHYIHDEAFVRHSKLQTVDLSRNKLEFIEPNTFKQNRFLITLSLANNELKLPEEGSFLNNVNLKVLHLSLCNLSNIPQNIFRELPNLEALYLSYNKLKVLPYLQSVKRLNLLDLSHNYLTYLNSEVFSPSPKLSHLNLSYNELSTLNTTVTSQLAKVSKREDLKGNPWVCDCTFYTVYSWCSSHGVNLEIVCSSPPICNEKLWTDCYKAGCDGVDQVEDMVTIGNTAVPSVGLENHGNKKASNSEETTLNFGRNGTGYTRQPTEGLGNFGRNETGYTRQPKEGLGNFGRNGTGYTRQPTEGLENHGHQKASDSFGIQMRKQEYVIIVYACIALTVTALIVFPIFLVIQIYRSKSRRLRDTSRDEGDHEAFRPLQNTECRTVREAFQNSYDDECVDRGMTQCSQIRIIFRRFRTTLFNTLSR
jgi:hypothetical protein